MIDYYCALAKHEAMQRLSAATRHPVSGCHDVEQEILRQARLLRAITITGFLETAWVKIRKAWSNRTEPTSIAGKDAIG